MSDTQIEMLLASRGKAVEDIAEEMMDILIRHFPGMWATRKALVMYGLTDRQCRLGRQHSKGLIIAGQMGYKLSQYATLDELRQAANMLHSQATAMLREEQELWRVLHGRGVVTVQQQKEGETI